MFQWLVIGDIALRGKMLCLEPVSDKASNLFDALVVLASFATIPTYLLTLQLQAIHRFRYFESS
jgi:hypothetical protein